MGAEGVQGAGEGAARAGRWPQGGHGVATGSGSERSGATRSGPSPNGR